MKTLYVSDLDGTLLRQDGTISQFTIQTINDLVEKGLLFSYATARSIVTASRVTKGLSNQIPVILYNGAFIRRPGTNELLASNFFGQEFPSILDDLIDHKGFKERAVHRTVFELILCCPICQISRQSRITHIYFGCFYSSA